MVFPRRRRKDQFALLRYQVPIYQAVHYVSPELVVSYSPTPYTFSQTHIHSAVSSHRWAVQVFAISTTSLTASFRRQAISGQGTLSRQLLNGRPFLDSFISFFLLSFLTPTRNSVTLSFICQRQKFIGPRPSAIDKLQYALSAESSPPGSFLNRQFLWLPRATEILWSLFLVI